VRDKGSLKGIAKHKDTGRDMKWKMDSS